MLHIWWFGLLVKLIAKLVQGDKLEKDSRSEDEVGFINRNLEREKNNLKKEDEVTVGVCNFIFLGN